MKHLKFILAILLTTIIQSVFAQNIGDLNGIYYQAVAIDEYGNEIVGMDIEGKPLYNKEIGVRFAITKGLDGVIQWEETHTTLTDKYGLFTLIIGKGTPTGNGSYARMLDIPWIDADQFLRVEISTRNDEVYKLVSNQQFMSVPYSFYTDDIADDAITTEKILDSAILNQDIHTGSVDTRTILDSTIINEDMASGSVDSRVILDYTILNEDIGTGSVDSRVLLNESIQAEDIDTGAVTTSEILDLTILNEDIADSTIDLTSKVSGILPTENGGTGMNISNVGNGELLIGDSITGAFNLTTLTAGVGIVLNNTPGNIEISTFGGINSSIAGNVQVNTILDGQTFISPAIPVQGVQLGNIVLGSINVNLQGCMMTTYVTGNNIIKVAIFNGTGSNQNFGTVELRVLVVQ